jgi:hypothetical protein
MVFSSFFSPLQETFQKFMFISYRPKISPYFAAREAGKCSYLCGHIVASNTLGILLVRLKKARMDVVWASSSCHTRYNLFWDF